ncbi:MAG: GntR family transcriptional regulator [Limisphaerales bacterium]
MIFQINFKSGLPVYLQLVEQVRAAVASAALNPGDPLPTIRPLAEQLRVNRNTVAKAYAELETQGIIETRPGRGCFIRENQSPLRKQVRREMLVAEIDQAIVAAHHLQLDKTEFLSIVEDRLNHFEERQRTHHNEKDSLS